MSAPSTMLKLGTKLPDFDLPDYNGTIVSSSDFEAQPLLVVFLCNHCPYVKHIIDVFADTSDDYQQKGIGVVGISVNDIDQYPEDAPEKMKEFATEHKMHFPYLYDETQEIAKAFKAACTPDLYLFNREHRLVYRGRFDESRPGNDIPVTGKDLTKAVEALVNGKPISEEQYPSAGCSLKWKPGNAPEYAR